MAGIQGKSRVKSSFLLTATALFAVVIACACQGASITKSTDRRPEVTLSLHVLSIPTLMKSGSSASKSISRLILPTSTTLTASMTPQGSGLSTPSPQVVPISSGSDTVTVSFSNVDLGTYTISAVATDSSGTAQCEGSSTVDVSSDSQNVTLNLFPVGFSVTTVAGNGFLLFDTTTMVPNEIKMFSIPSEQLSIGESVPAGYYEIYQLSASMPLMVIATDTDGNLLYEGYWETGILTTLGGTSIVNSSSGYGDVYVGPCPSSSATTLIFVNRASTNSVSARFLNAGW
jgi:hypothetical protein